MFDIHNVKPVHGWREFFGEVGIIVIGVLIALTAEQIVERLHWHSRVTEAHQALQAELVDVYQTAAERVIQTPCLNAQLDILKTRVLGSGAALTPAPVFQTMFGPTVYKHTSRLWDDTVWQSTLSEQVVSHFSLVERQQLAAAYNGISLMRRLNTEEDAAGGLLNALSAPLPLDPSLRGHFVELIEADRQRANLMSLVANQIMEGLRRVMPELSDTLHDRSWLQEMHQPNTTISYCRTHRLSLAPMPTT